MRRTRKNKDLSWKFRWEKDRLPAQILAQVKQRYKDKEKEKEVKRRKETIERKLEKQRLQVRGKKRRLNS